MGGLKDKVVIITGASSGIGAVTAEEFAKHGAWLSLTGRNKKRLQKTADLCAKHGTPKDKIVLTTCDLSDPEPSCNLIIQETLKKFGRIDVLVNNAGTAKLQPMEEVTLQQLDFDFALLLKSPFYLSMKALPHLKQTKGCIINISSVLSNIAVSLGVGYGMMKAGMDYFSRSLAMETAACGVRVNTVNPGYVDTDLPAAAGVPKDQIPKFLERVKETIPLRRVGDPRDIAATIVFLACDKAKFFTGSHIVQDGGQSISFLPPVNMD